MRRNRHGSAFREVPPDSLPAEWPALERILSEHKGEVAAVITTFHSPIGCGPAGAAPPRSSVALTPVAGQPAFLATFSKPPDSFLPPT